ncbi:MAG: hypothetical protein LBF09_06845 [Odoribacteraceae bacterium]|jgi:hypothetical protein|nr:hypothetical protein [Odoribacteraceae bacterium]
MAKKKKKTPPKPARELNSQTFFNERVAAVRKMLQVYGFNPGVLEAFTKKQLQYLMHPLVEQPRFKVQEGHRVPRRLLDFVAEEARLFMKRKCFGDPKVGFTFLELATHGQAFACAVMAEHWKPTFPPEQSRIIKYLAACFDDNRVAYDLDDVTTHIHHLAITISKINYRVYGFSWTCEAIRAGRKIRVTNPVLMSSEETKTIRFVHKQKERPAFLVKTGRVVTAPAQGARIARSLVTGEECAGDDFLDIYIQSHALQRVKERVDVFSAHKRNYHVTCSLVYHQHVVDCPGNRKMLACCDEMVLDGKAVHVPFGYFPFVIEGDKLIVTTCLPLVSVETWTGKLMREKLGLQVEDMKYLGMDKMSFYLTVDLDELPALKEVVDQTDLRYLRNYSLYNHDLITYHLNMLTKQDGGKTQMVKRFLDTRGESKRR